MIAKPDGVEAITPVNETGKPDGRMLERVNALVGKGFELVMIVGSDNESAPSPESCDNWEGKVMVAVGRFKADSCEGGARVMSGPDAPDPDDPGAEGSPADGRANPEDGNASPEDGKANPEDGKANPEDGKASAEGAVNPEDGKAAGDANPEDGKASAEGATKDGAGNMERNPS